MNLKILTIMLLGLCGLLSAQETIKFKANFTLEDAKSICDFAVTEANKRGVGGAFAVVDQGGHLIYLSRIDGTFPAGSKISIGKAKAAALFGKNTNSLEEMTNNERQSYIAVPKDYILMKGGIPIIIKGQIVGSIGVSGTSSANEDEELGLLAVKQFSTSTKKN